MPRRVVLLATLGLVGCATPPPIEVPRYVPVPAACLLPCAYAGPAQITTNGDLLEAHRGRVEQVACYESRLQCVEQATGPVR